ncbi:MAG: hypothetical protein GY751_25730 [Bacteroidetes bacterium]|nr:hypothetical protein [Bacteroidota bacterium]
MKTIGVRLLMPVLLILLVVTSCTKDDVATIPMGEVDFTSLLMEFDEARIVEGLPLCTEAYPFTVCVGIKDAAGAWILDQTPDEPNDHIIEIKIAPASLEDIDLDGDWDKWFTEESESLELPEGVYTIEYFIVKDAAGNEIYAAPLEGVDYGDIHFENFVTDALPIEFLLLPGTKKYVEVEVLCYEEHFAYEFGYVFFDVIEIESQFVCLFGNWCDETGRHHPAHFRFKAWYYDETAPDGKGLILFNGVNTFGVNALGEYYAEPLVVTLPDREFVIEEFFGEIWLIDATGFERLIRWGMFTEHDLEEFYNPRNPDHCDHYWHFREGCGSCDDQPELLEGGEDCQPGVPECVQEYRGIMEELGVTIYEGLNPPNIEGIFEYDAIVLDGSNVPGDVIGSSYSNIKIRLTNQVGPLLTYEYKSSTTTSMPGPGYVSGFSSPNGDFFTLYSCDTLLHTATGEMAIFAYVYSGMITPDGVVNADWALFNVDDLGFNAIFIDEGTGRHFHEVDGIASRVAVFKTSDGIAWREDKAPEMK